MRFFELWTLKEAYIKARGLGLALPLDGFSYHFEPQLSLQIRPDLQDDGADWQSRWKRLAIRRILERFYRNADRAEFFHRGCAYWRFGFKRVDGSKNHARK